MKKPRFYEGSLFSGMSAGGWCRLLVRNRLAVSPSRLPLALAISAMSPVNTGLRWVQNLVYGRRIRAVQVPEDPVFIIGHWRTGTTMLHELLDLDSENRCPTTYESLSPNHFLLTEKLVRRWLRFMMPKKRPMDNVRIGFDRPQEDEAALCNLGSPSPFLSVAFPNRPLQDPQYVTLAELSPARRAAWESRLRRFLQTLLLKRSGRLVLKSPQHTFRIPALLEMFPAARFVYIARDPWVVFPSTVHFWKTMFHAYAVQHPRNEGLQTFVLDTFAAMHQSFQSSRDLIPSGRLVELKYEDLVADPVAEVGRIYQQLELGDYQRVRPAIEHYASRAKTYKTNRYELEPDVRETIAARWADYIAQYGYSPADA